MEDKCANKAAVCMLCEHEGLEYYQFPCDNCNHNGGEHGMFLPKFGSNAVTESTIKDSGERRVFETGAVRDCAEGKGRCDLLPLCAVGKWLNDQALLAVGLFVNTHDERYLEVALDYIAEKHFSCKADLVLEMAIHMEDGLKKYPERNWENGISIHSFVDSGVRHYLKVLRGDDDENHLRACVWNLMCCIWTMRNKPGMDDLPKKEKNND